MPETKDSAGAVADKNWAEMDFHEDDFKDLTTSPEPNLMADLSEFATLKDEISMEEQAVKDKKAICLDLEAKIYDLMESQDIQKISVGGRTLYRKIDTYASVKDVEKGYKWLKANDFGDLFKETINARTLTAAIKDFVEEGGVVDDSINITIKRRIGMRKS